MVHLPDDIADELAGRLRVRRVSAAADLSDSDTSALSLLARSHSLDALSVKRAARLATTVEEHARRGRLSKAFAAVKNAPISHVDDAVLEALLQASASAGQIKRAAYVIEELFPRFQVSPTANAFALYVDACGRVGNLQRAVAALASESFVKLQVDSKSAVYERVVNACVRCGALDQAERLVHHMKESAVPRTEQIYVNLLTGTAKSRPVDRSLTILKLMRRDGFDSQNLRSYNALIFGCSQAGRLRDALSFYDTIVHSDAMRPNLDTFNALLSCCARASDPNTAFDVLHRMTDEAGITPNAKCYNWVVVACARVGDVKRAFEVARKMRQEGIRLNVVTNNNLLEACCNAGRLERAFVLVKTMIQEERVTPNAHTYNTLIRGCGRWGQLDAALRMLRSMRSARVCPTVITYSVAVDACAKTGGSVAVERAFELVDEMQENGLEPNVVTYNSLIHACAKAKDVDKAFVVLERMRNEKVSPDFVTLCSLVDACGRAGQIEKAFQAMEQLPKEFPSVHQPNVPAYNALIHGCFKADDIDGMNMALRDMKRLNLRPNVVTFSTLISAYAAAGNLEKAITILGEMKAAGFSPNRVTFTSIIAGYGHQGNVESAMKVFEEARESCGEPDEELYTAAIVAAISGGCVDLAVKLAMEMNRAGYIVPSVLNGMMRRVGDVERTGQELRNMLKAMEALKIRPQRAALESLVAAYAKEGDVAAAFAVLPDMERLEFPPNLQTYKKLIQACAMSGDEVDLERGRSLFFKLRSEIRDGDYRLRSYHWVELYEAMIRAAGKDLRITLLKSMATDCGPDRAKDLASRVCSEVGSTIDDAAK